MEIDKNEWKWDEQENRLREIIPNNKEKRIEFKND